MYRFAAMIHIVIVLLSLVQNSDSVASRNATLQSDLMAQAFLHQDYPTFERYAYPGLTRLLGGKDKLEAVLKQGRDMMDQQGLQLNSIDMQRPASIVKTPATLQCVLRETMNYSTFTDTVYIIGVSRDKGLHWTFLNAGKKDLATLRKTFPELSTELKIPASQ
jgi:hypothetical protein